MTAVTVTLAGNPQGKGRARSFLYRRKDTDKLAIGHHTPQRTATYEGMIRTAAMEAMAKAGLPAPMEGPLGIDMRAVFPVPQSWSKKKREQALAGEVKPTKKPDADNILKAWKDAMNGVVFLDDAQIVQGRFAKTYGPAPSVTITVIPLGGATACL
jgi:Holliday junction resolvase RusA-like endonuclease